MTLRTSVATTVSRSTSGPGRARGSDGRSRRRRAAAVVDAEAARRRAEALFGVPVAPGGAAGPSPGALPPPELPPEPVAEPEPEAVAVAGEPVAARSVGVGARPLPWHERVRERLPVWVQLRCGLEPRALAAVAVVLVGAVGFAATQLWSGRPDAVAAPEITAVAPPTPRPEPSRVVVDVSGKVRVPGVRRLPAGARVEDALAAAGGVRPGADTSGLNRARVLVDGEQVLVGVTGPAPGPGAVAGTGAAGPATPVSLSTATVEQLDGLPGVGPVLAQHIVDFRTARGGFRSVEDLRQVNGIGERRFADLRALVRP
ncbi:helix-hairpin-helix domain-containing protein [Streptomyces sp. NPDC101132]|uniref:helix-hairpin-helix domain-containing protein n=1 Tax=Streptomyces sp. NPDC101132 TaxID=3366110 RepID=UPI0037F6C22D